MEFVGPWSEALQAAVLVAEARIEAEILGDLPDVVLPSWAGPLATVDDLVIRVEFATMDGVGGTLGDGVPILVRSDSLLPITARMRLDADDAALLQADGVWDEVVLHEMLHCLGFGGLWGAKGLVAPDGIGYIGPGAMAEYAAMGGFGPVPLETAGGPGTAGVHWSEAMFGPELMTGWIGDSGILAPLTLASLGDLGYGLAPYGTWMTDASYA
ncbi:MAG TPA: leishmanolysin-related zinc metalloendopeptidase [Acetobacteraceae bacterium]|nr:leishmanolysin-related zinc metalloendopeptidase [Acetobacteraceae bacterium]